MEPLVGRTIAHYRIQRVLGEGGMASVYLADDLKHHRQVAVKVMKPEIVAAIGDRRFLVEIETAARLNHPHILPLFDSGAADGQLFYVTPYIPGESLRARLLRDKQLPLEESLRIAQEIASALGHAHHQGLVHRDIKPENVLLSEGIALVADFGIARVLSAPGGDGLARTATATATGVILGTPQYMSPEQATGGDVNAGTDVYALACVLYEMLAGEPPFVATTGEALIRQHLSVEARPVALLRPAVPRAVSSVIAKALSKIPADRYLTAARFAQALTFAMSSDPSTQLEEAGAVGTPNNLPVQRTSFVGRVGEVAECGQVLTETRLLTLTGIGGCGKTRLAIKLAGSQLGNFPDGVWFADLASVADEGRVAEAVAGALGVREEAGKSLFESLRQHVRGKRLLIVLDNCEHLALACAALADGLLRAGEELRLVATSREGLGVEGERLFSLRSLALPPSEAAGDLQAARASDAVRLFVDRAEVALPGFALGAANAAGVVEICRRLDGIPLAIELAAARLRILSVEQIRSKLDDRFRLLTGGSRTALPRHQTLRATIQWSYEQLTADEQRLFRVLSVFSGGWSLELATRVAWDGADEFEVMDLLEGLVGKSLVVIERDLVTEPRYSLLETVRQYARERLHDMGETDAARHRHLTEFLALAERAYVERFIHEETWASTLEVEHDNLRASLAFARASDVERHLETAGALAWFWQARSHLNEGREHLTAALAASRSSEPRPALARALWGAANAMAWQGDAASGLPRMEEALQLWRVLQNRQEVALALEGLGMTRFLAGDEDAAREACEECLRLQREEGDRVLINRAMVALAQVLVGVGDLVRARALSEEIVAFSRSVGDRRSEHFGLHYLADCALTEGRCEDSLQIYGESLALAQAIGDRLETSFELQGVAMSLAGLGDDEGAARLVSAARAEWGRLGADVHMKFWDRLLDRYIGRAWDALGPEVSERVAMEGRLLPFDEACSMGLKIAGGNR